MCHISVVTIGGYTSIPRTGGHIEAYALGHACLCLRRERAVMSTLEKR